MREGPGTGIYGRRLQRSAVLEHGHRVPAPESLRRVLEHDWINHRRSSVALGATLKVVDWWLALGFHLLRTWYQKKRNWDYDDAKRLSSRGDHGGVEHPAAEQALHYARLLPGVAVLGPLRACLRIEGVAIQRGPGGGTAVQRRPGRGCTEIVRAVV
ncbi:MAG: hypothetical protein ACOC5M_00385 [Chloroflexota bacterium]